MSHVSMWDAPPLNQIMIVDLATLLRGGDEPSEVGDPPGEAGDPQSNELRLGETSPRALVLAASSVRRSIRDPAENGSGSMVAISSREVSEYPLILTAKRDLLYRGMEGNRSCGKTGIEIASAAVRRQKFFRYERFLF